VSSLENISDTALWVAYYRALESKRKDALFKDLYAERLIGSRGKKIAREIGKPWLVSWAVAVRTAVIDELVLRMVEAQDVRRVVNLACGLDTRPYRLSVPRDLLWIEMDLPDIMDHKSRLLSTETPRCVLERKVVDLSDPPARRKAFLDLNETPLRTLVITEGLLVYLDAQNVASLSQDLFAQRSFHYWTMDIYSPRLLGWTKFSHWDKKFKKANSPFLFAPREGSDFFTPLGWKKVEYRPTLREAERLRRAIPLTFALRLMGRFSSEKRRESNRNLSGILLLERSGENH